MLRLMTTSAAALALLATPILAQDAGTQDGADTAGGAMWDTARQSAESAGMSDVQNIEGAFVLQGTSQAGLPVLMIVGSSGELLALAAPIAAPGAGGATGQESGGASAGQASGASSEDPAAASAADAAPEPGQPADSGFMATQADPASPHAWDPMIVEGAMRQLELGMRDMAGQISEPSQPESGAGADETQSGSGSQAQ